MCIILGLPLERASISTAPPSQQVYQQSRQCARFSRELKPDRLLPQRLPRQESHAFP